MLDEALQTANQAGREQSNQDLNQKMEGLQSRIDRMNASKAEADRMNSADHSKIQQLDELFKQSIEVVNYNSRVLQSALHQMQQPLEFDGRDVLKAFEQAAGTSAQQLITQKTAETILNVKTQAEQDKQDILKVQKRLTRSMNLLRGWLTIALPASVLALIVPWLWLKLVILVLGLIGGLFYEPAK